QRTEVSGRKSSGGPTVELGLVQGFPFAVGARANEQTNACQCAVSLAVAGLLATQPVPPFEFQSGNIHRDSKFNSKAFPLTQLAVIQGEVALPSAQRGLLPRHFLRSTKRRRGGFDWDL